MAKGKGGQISQSRIRLLQFWSAVRPIACVLLSLAVVALIVGVAVRYVLSNYVLPVDTQDATPIEVTIPKSASASSIARILKDACGEGKEGLIKSTASFKIYVDFIGKASELKAGTYYLSKNMTIDEMVNIICTGNPKLDTVRLTVPEGYTVRDIADLLVNNQLLANSNEFYNLCNDGARFSKYSFIEALSNRSERTFLLEGYLFPDTYEVYLSDGAEQLITKMLDRFKEIYTDELNSRANELGMTTDQIITLASIIEREAGSEEDFAKVSAVFHNRIKQSMRLESCATLSYALGMHKYTFSAEELATVSPYNTYKNQNLPIGAISNPGLRAISAALYPDEGFLQQNYLYFCTTNPAESNRLVFAKTADEHEQNVAMWKEYWQ